MCDGRGTIIAKPSIQLPDLMDRRKFLQWALSHAAVLPAALSAAARDRHGDLLPLRRLGRTEEQVTMLGLGGWHLGQMNAKNAQQCVEAAIAGGIRFFDSAESYQGGGSERYLGNYLVPKYRDEVFLMTKTTAGTARQARQHLEDSLRRMNTDQMDLWQMHAIHSPADVDRRISNGVWDVMEEAMQEGKTRFIGFTGHANYTAHQHMLSAPRGAYTVQMPINVLDASYNSFSRNVLPEAVTQDLGIIAMKTLANGGFFGGSQHGQHGPNPKVVPDRLSIQEALHYTWSLPVSVIVTGPDNIAQLEEKIALARSFNGMDESTRAELVARVADMAGNTAEFYKS